MAACANAIKYVLANKGIDINTNYPIIEVKTNKFISYPVKVSLQEILNTSVMVSDESINTLNSGTSTSSFMASSEESSAGSFTSSLYLYTFD
ncbi:MAG: hypothetical protein EZS28_051008 [Streblomastix strix]|uniref:Uncharacterized protein n=1 Tax=Streblomastix strix TaxID=222440 RepID=A0A5J4T7W0_9EUKA|nr:MAG: hypothetical protein EZS28_051008 [Streblomastix strix]